MGIWGGLIVLMMGVGVSLGSRGLSDRLYLKKKAKQMHICFYSVLVIEMCKRHYVHN